MPMLDALRKGFNYFLLSFGVSSPASKPRPAPKPAAPKPAASTSATPKPAEKDKP